MPTKSIDQKQPNMRRNLTLCPSKAPRTPSYIVSCSHAFHHSHPPNHNEKQVTHTRNQEQDTIQHQAPWKPAINITTPSLLTCKKTNPQNAKLTIHETTAHKTSAPITTNCQKFCCLLLSAVDSTVSST